jgi:hypothetical protein
LDGRTHFGIDSTGAAPIDVYMTPTHDTVNSLERFKIEKAARRGANVAISRR